MPAEMAAEATEIVTSGIDKFLSTENFEKAAQNIKEALDKKFGPTWHVCVGEVRVGEGSAGRSVASTRASLT
jgi:dynein light chain 4, axonemal